MPEGGLVMPSGADSARRHWRTDPIRGEHILRIWHSERAFFSLQRPKKVKEFADMSRTFDARDKEWRTQLYHEGAT